MFPSLEQIVDDAATAAGIDIPEQLPEEDKTMSKSARVREYLSEHPEARNRDVAEALSQYGVKAADVANVKANLRKKEAKAGKSSKPAKSSSAASPSSGKSEADAVAMIDASIQLDLLEAGVEFVRKAGGVNEAQHVIGVIRRIRSL